MQGKWMFLRPYKTDKRNIMTLKIAFISDIHHGADGGTRRGTMAIPLMRRFRQWLLVKRPDMLVDLGDRIGDAGRDKDLKLMSEIGREFQAVACERFHILGNHDVGSLSIQDNEDTMGVSFRPQSITRKGVTSIMWNNNVRLDYQKGFRLDQPDLDWLEKALDAASYPVIIFTHVPLDSGCMVGNYYFENTLHHAHYPDDQSKKVRDIIERSGKVILCVNGHAHWDKYHSVDGIHYVSVPSLTETFMTYPDAHSAWGMVAIGRKSIKIDIEGKAPMSYVLPIRRQGHHWQNEFKDYAPKACL